MAVATSTALLIAGIASTAATTGVQLYNQHQQGEANDRAASLASQSSRDQLGFAQTQADRDQANFEKTFAENQREWEATQARNFGIWQQREGQLAPYRATSLAANNTINGLLGGHPSSQAGGTLSDLFAPNAPSASQSAAMPIGQATQMFKASMQKHGLDPVAVQGHGATIAAALNQDYPGLGVTVDPKTDAVVWPGFGPLDVTIDSGKGGWDFRPSGSSSGPAAPAASARQNTLAALMQPTSPNASYLQPPGAAMPSSPFVRTAAAPAMDAFTLYQLMHQYGQPPGNGAGFPATGNFA